ASPVAGRWLRDACIGSSLTADAGAAARGQQFDLGAGAALLDRMHNPRPRGCVATRPAGGDSIYRAREWDATVAEGAPPVHLQPCARGRRSGGGELGKEEGWP